MNRFMALFGVACLITPGFAAATCEEVRQRIADGMTAGGLKGFRLEIVPTEQVDVQVDTLKVVATCEASSKVILYYRAAPADAAAPPSTPSGVAPDEDATAEDATAEGAAATPQPSKSSAQLTPAAHLLAKPGRAEGALRTALSEGGAGR